jgi:hypothetical protein
MSYVHLRVLQTNVLSTEYGHGGFRCMSLNINHQNIVTFDTFTDVGSGTYEPVQQTAPVSYGTPYQAWRWAILNFPWNNLFFSSLVYVRAFAFCHHCKSSVLHYCRWINISLLFSFFLLRSLSQTVFLSLSCPTHMAKDVVWCCFTKSE